MLVPYDLAEQEPDLFERLAAYKQLEGADALRDAKSKWTRSGPGPVALIGNRWASGVMLAPMCLCSSRSSIIAISYWWDQSKLLLWEPYTKVRLLITDAHSMESWVIDVSNSPDGTLIMPAKTSISANCQVVLQMTSGSITGRLKEPPYIPTHGVTVRYRF